MTQVLQFGVFDKSIQMTTTNYHKISRVVFPPYKFSKQNKVKYKEKEQSLRFIKVQCSENHTFLIEANGDLWAFGPSPDGQLGIVNREINYPVNITSIMKQQFISISADSYLIVGQTTNNKIYAWGNQQKIINIQNKKSIIFEARFEQDYKIEAFDISENIIRNLYRNNYSNKNINRQDTYRSISQSQIVVTQTSQSLIENSPLININGFDCQSEQMYFYTDQKLISLLKKENYQINIRGISCGTNHTLAWDNEGNVWSWGVYQDGKLGYMDFNSKEQKIPKLVEGLNSFIIQCTCSENGSLALDDRGKLYFWGMGLEKLSLVKALEPRKIECQNIFTKIVSGFFHFGAIDLLGQLFLWGINTYNCLGDLPDIVYEPTQLSFEGQKVIDISMYGNKTVIIMPKQNNKQQLPQLSKLNYLQISQSRIASNTNLIRDKKERKEKLLQIYQISQTERLKEKKDNNEYDKTNLLLQKIRTTIDNKYYNQQFNNSIQENSINNDINQSKIYTPLDYDQIQTKIRKLELKNPIFLPVIFDKYNSVIDDNEKQIDLNSIIQTDDEFLKCQYICMIKQQGEETVLKNLLKEQPQQQQIITTKDRVKSIPKTLINKQMNKFKDNYDNYDLNILERIKTDIQNSKSERYHKFVRSQHLKQAKFEQIKQKLILNPQIQNNQEYQLEILQNQADQRNKRTINAQNKKKQVLNQKIERTMRDLYLKSPEHRAEIKLENEKKQRIQQQLYAIIEYLNYEILLQMLIQSISQSRAMKTLQLKEKLQARIIQQAIRKRNIKIKLASLSEKQLKIISTFIFKIRLNLNIKLKRKMVNKIYLFNIRKQLNKKIFQRLNIILKATLKIQNYIKQKYKQQQNQLN